MCFSSVWCVLCVFVLFDVFVCSYFFNVWCVCCVYSLWCLLWFVFVCVFVVLMTCRLPSPEYYHLLMHKTLVCIYHLPDVPFAL